MGQFWSQLGARVRRWGGERGRVVMGSVPSGFLRWSREVPGGREQEFCLCPARGDR